jgi:hypothetical protein
MQQLPTGDSNCKGRNGSDVKDERWKIESDCKGGDALGVP